MTDEEKKELFAEYPDLLQIGITAKFPPLDKNNKKFRFVRDSKSRVELATEWALRQYANTLKNLAKR